MRKLLVLACLFVLSEGAYAHGHLTDDLLSPEKEIIATYKYHSYHIEKLNMFARDIEILGVNLKENEMDLYLTRNQYGELIAQGYELILNEQKNAPTAPDQEYKSAEEIEEFLKVMHQRYPEITKLVSVGKSLEGRDIWAIKISD